MSPGCRRRRAGGLAGWVLPSAALIFLPKCPLCVAMYVALFTGASISLAHASLLRTGVMALCVATLVGLFLRKILRAGGCCANLRLARRIFPHRTNPNRL